MPPAFQRREHHEQIVDAIAFVSYRVALVARLGAARSCRADQCPARFGQGPSVADPAGDSASSILKRSATISRVALGSITRRRPTRFYVVFHRDLPDHQIAARLDNVQFDDLLLEQAQAPTSETLRGRREVSAINFASATPSKIRGRAELGLYLRLNIARALPDSGAWPLEGRCWCPAPRHPAFAPALPSPKRRLQRMRVRSSWAERLPLRINSSSWACSSPLNRTTYF